MEHEREEDEGAENPYGRPTAQLSPPAAQAPRWPRIAARLISILIAVFCSLQFVVMGVVILRYVKLFGFTAVPVGFVVQSLLTPFTLALAGIFLAFGRRVAVALFVAHLCQRAFEFGGNGGRFETIPVGLVLAFLCYSIVLWKGGVLTGWPRGWTRERAS